MKKLSEGQPEGPVSIRLSRELQDQLDYCAVKTGLKVTDLMRLCMRIGMEHFKRIDFDTAKCIVEAVEAKRPAENIIPLRKPVQYTTGQGGSVPERRIAEEHDKDNNEP